MCKDAADYIEDRPRHRSSREIVRFMCTLSYIIFKYGLTYGPTVVVDPLAYMTAWDGLRSWFAILGYPPPSPRLRSTYYVKQLVHRISFFGYPRHNKLTSQARSGVLRQVLAGSSISLPHYVASRSARLEKVYICQHGCFQLDFEIPDTYVHPAGRPCRCNLQLAQFPLHKCYFIFRLLT